MEGIYTQTTQLLTQPEEYLRPSKRLEEAWKEQTQAMYNFLKKEEDRHELPAIPGALPRLQTDGLDIEQVWQLVELQNKALLAAPEDLDGLDHTNLCFMVARLSSLAKHDKLSRANELLTEDEGIGGSPQESDDMDDDDDDDNDMKEDEEEMDNAKEVSDEDMSGDDEDLFEKPDDLKDTGLNDVFGDDSDDEEDNFDDFIAKEGVESDDDDEDEVDKKKKQGGEANIEDSEARQEKKKEGKKFGKTEIDTTFFSLRESEWVADQDAIGENYSGDDEDIDLMADISDSSEEEDGIMYDAFFDQAPEGTGTSRGLGKKLSEMLEDEEEVGYEEKADHGAAKDLLKDDTGDNEESGTQLLGGPKKESKSTFEKEREKELELMEQLEDENLNEKPWYLKGEVGNADRPQNSTLEEHLEYDIAVRQKPIITEDTTSHVEKIIMGRIRIKAWDDVERKVRPTADPFEFKKKLVLEQDKSKKSLAEIYEEEYLKKQKEEVEAEEEELEEHKEIKERMDKLFVKLDALSNYHYTPRQPGADVKIVSNLPAITVEETTPATASDATLLAPQEILEPTRGEMVGDTERTTTDRKRDRRIKKHHQKKKAKMQEKKLQEKVRQAGAKGGTGKLDRSSTMKVIEKAVKSGQVKLLEGSQDKAVKSSQTFFKQLQDTRSKKQKNENTKKRKKGQFSASKLMM
ncbi:U3 small nucleolar ribonucleoprotein protein MPP10-like [Portunus trituberculatus]|uniref:U3 small nucleolar ribonucleoprotein protein MPP10-like n=1 Tax=Portunus trituberculatus TaxID=210409 RepID=UPI001E1D1E3D|nr:U3 small nucleolar ribonucleoprotein protein MPP10-like [Portunus trituberculatus]